jgi:hypothetical protein
MKGTRSDLRPLSSFHGVLTCRQVLECLDRPAGIYEFTASEEDVRASTRIDLSCHALLSWGKDFGVMSWQVFEKSFFKYSVAIELWGGLSYNGFLSVL